MYDLIIYLYLLGVAVTSLFKDKVRKMWLGERAAFDVLREKIDPAERYVWFHAASLGEFEQGRPLMERLRREHPELKILLTFFSPSGYEVRKNYEGADVICYLPLDTPLNVRRFFSLVQPAMAFFIKYEFWYNYLHELKRRQIPVYSVSSIFRHGQVFFRWYGRQYGRVLKCFTHFFVQNEVSRDLLATLGIDCVSIVGDTRFDRVLDIKAAARQLPVVETFLSKRSAIEEQPQVFIAGSSWPPDEQLFIPYMKAHPQIKLIIAPHVVSEQHIADIMAQLKGLRVVRYKAAAKAIETDDKETAAGIEEANVLIIDNYGLLSSIYRYATISYIGGGFGVGIHNVLEAAVWGVPVLFGPNNKRFQEAQALIATGGGFEVNSPEDFELIMGRLTNDPDHRNEAASKAAALVASQAGATDKVYRHAFGQ